MSVIDTPNPKMTPEEVVRQLRALREHILDFTQLDALDRVSLSVVAHADPEFVIRGINAIGASDALEGAIGHSADNLRKDDDYTNRCVAVSDELRTFLDGVDSAITVRRHRIGMIALQAYQIGRQLVRRKEHAGLLPHIQAMREHNRFGRRRAKPADAKPDEPQVKPEPPAPQSKPQ